jgi:hypothetical protein
MDRGIEDLCKIRKHLSLSERALEVTCVQVSIEGDCHGNETGRIEGRSDGTIDRALSHENQMTSFCRPEWVGEDNRWSCVESECLIGLPLGYICSGRHWSHIPALRTNASHRAAVCLWCCYGGTDPYLQRNRALKSSGWQNGRRIPFKLESQRHCWSASAPLV